MAKRFTDTGKWDKGSFMALPPKMKLAWQYLCDKCDHAGVWDINIALMNTQVGEEYTLEALVSGLGERVELLGKSKLLLVDFVEFQYGKLNPNNSVHRSVLLRLGKVAPTKPLDSPSQGAKDKDKDKDKEEDKDKDSSAPAKPILSDDVKQAVAEWDATLKHFEIERAVGIRDELAIARAVQTYGTDWVKLAFRGARKQTKGRTFDPKNFVSLSIYLHKDRIERLVNIGAGKESAEGIDWAKVFS